MTAYTTHIEDVQCGALTRDRVANLLKRYPHAPDTDRRAIFQFMQCCQIARLIRCRLSLRLLDLLGLPATAERFE